MLYQVATPSVKTGLCLTTYPILFHLFPTLNKLTLKTNKGKKFKSTEAQAPIIPKLCLNGIKVIFLNYKGKIRLFLSNKKIVL